MRSGQRVSDGSYTKQPRPDTAVQLQHQRNLRHTARSRAHRAEMGLRRHLPRTRSRSVVWRRELTEVMAGVIFILVLMHRRAQTTTRIKLEDYYREQTA